MTITANDLAQFTGTNEWFKHWTPGFTYTDGVKYLADKAGAHWLIDLVASWQTEAAVRKEEFQVWDLTVNREKGTAVAICTDGNDNEVARQEIEYTDFPLDKVRLFFANGVLLLPSEY